MPLDYLELHSQIESYAEKAVVRRSELAHKLQNCLILFTEYNQRLPELQQAVEEAATQNKGMRCAEPVDEFLKSRKPVSLPAPPCTILAADGSQINPDPHGEVLYGLINVGIFRMQPGSGLTPTTETHSELLADDRLNPVNGPVSEELIALMRDSREREILAELTEKEGAPLVTLTDGPLELYHEPRQDKAYEIYFKKYLRAMDELALRRVITAGYVDRPRADLVVRMLELVAPRQTEERPFKGVSDLSLYQTLLLPGERSAIFRLQSSSTNYYSNDQETGKNGPKTLHFFYLNVGVAGKPALARVEIPQWVASDPSALDLLQSVLVEQSAQAGRLPYPYPLIRAHETAVVKMDDHRQVTEMINIELVRHGFQPGFQSNKQFHKH